MSTAESESSNPGAQGSAQPTTQTTAGQRLAASLQTKAAKKAARSGSTEPLQQAMHQRFENAGLWLGSRKTPVLVAILVLMAMAGATVSWAWTTKNQKEQAGALLEKGLEYATSPLETDAPAEDGAAKAKRTFKDEKARAEAAQKAFKLTYAKYPNADPALWARLGEGQALLETSRFAEASAMFRKALAQSQEHALAKARALEGLGFALEGQKKFAEARAEFQKLTQISDNYTRLLGEYHVARMWAQAQESKKAAGLLHTLIKKLRKHNESEGKAAYKYTLEQSEQLLALIDPTFVPERASSGLGDLSSEEFQELMRRFNMKNQ